MILIKSFVFLLAIHSAWAVEFNFEQSSTVPIVYLNVALKTGSISDPEGQSGITNFMGEMLLRGTSLHSKAQLDEALDLIGAKIAVETRTDSMMIRVAVLTSKLNELLPILTEIITQPKFSESEVSKLRSEIVSGLLQGLADDTDLGSKRFQKFLLTNHPYGNPVDGTPDQLSKVTSKQVRTHYDKIVRDNLLLIVGTGDADTATLQTWARNLGQVRAGTGEITPLTSPVDARVPRLLIVDKPERTQTQIYVGQVGLRMDHPDFFPIYLGNHIFGGNGFQARLIKEIRVKRGWSYGAGSSFRHGRVSRYWNIHLFPAAKDSAAALEVTLKLLKDFVDHGITEQEFSYAREGLINNSGFMYNTPRKRVENRLLERTLNLPDGFMQTYADRLSKVSLSDVNLAVKRYFKPEAQTIAVVATARDLKEKLMSAAHVTEDRVTVKPYTQEN